MLRRALVASCLVTGISAGWIPSSLSPAAAVTVTNTSDVTGNYGQIPELGMPTTQHLWPRALAHVNKFHGHFDDEPVSPSQASDAPTGPLPLPAIPEQVHLERRDQLSLVVSQNVLVQSFEGWGTSLAWWASFAGQQNMNVQTNLLDAFFNVNSGLGFNIVRYNIGAGARQDELQYYGNYRAMPAWQAASNVAMDPTADIGQLNILRGAMARGVNIIEAFANSPPPWMTISGSSMGQPDGSDNLSPARYAEYANYMARAVQWLNSQGVPVRTVAAMNEPSAGWWLQHKDSNKSQEGCAINRANHNGIYQAMSLALQRFGSTTVISAADENSLTAASDSLKLMGNFPRVQQINIHGYFATIDFDTNLVNEFRARVGNRRLWMSEFGLPGQDMTSGIALALSIVRDLVQLRVQAWVYWQALDEGDEWGLINAPLASTHFENGLPQIGKQYWVIAQFCKHIRPGWSIVGTTATADLRTVAAVPPNRSSLVIVVVNKGSNDGFISLDGSAHVPTQGFVSGWRTSFSEDYVQIGSVRHEGGKLNVQVPALSVTTYQYLV